MNTVKCPNCGYENKNTNIRCESCKMELNSIEQNNKKCSKERVIYVDLGKNGIKHLASVLLIIILTPWLITGLAFFGVSTYSIITDNNKSKGYVETEGKLVDYEIQDSKVEEDGYFVGVYEYKVNGVTYKGSPSSVSTQKVMKETITVKYNPDNPEEYVMEAGWNKLQRVGFTIVIIVVVIFVSVKIYVKQIYDRAYGIKKDN